jgi:hypothetical protein
MDKAVDEKRLMVVPHAFLFQEPVSEGHPQLPKERKEKFMRSAPCFPREIVRQIAILKRAFRAGK